MVRGLTRGKRVLYFLQQHDAGVVLIKGSADYDNDITFIPVLDYYAPPSGKRKKLADLFRTRVI